MRRGIAQGVSKRDCHMIYNTVIYTYVRLYYKELPVYMYVRIFQIV